MQTAKIFQNGKSQAVRLPKEFRFAGDQVFVKRVGNTVVLIPYNAPWVSLVNSLSHFSPDFLEEREQPSIQERETFFK
jgi:antitoxin VapB